MSMEPWKGQRVGNLRERITFRGDAEIIGHNAFNEPIYGDPVEIEVAARAEPIKGVEIVEAVQINASHDITFHVRHIDGITATWEIEWQGRTYNIMSWRNLDERRRYLSIEAKAES